MRDISPNPSWPELWRTCYEYDKLEVFLDRPRVAYSYAYRRRRSQAVDALKRVVRAPASVLDVAGAQGNFSLALAEMGYQVTWNDFRQELIDYIELKREPEVPLEYRPGNIFDLDIGPFDAVLMTEVIEHVAHPDQFLCHVAKLVRPGGKIVLTTPNGAYQRNKLPRFSDCPDPSIFEQIQFQPNADGHIFLLHRDEVVRLADQANLQVEQLSFFTNFLTSGHVGTARLVRRLPVKAIDWLETLTSRWNGRLGQKINCQMMVILSKPV